MHCFAASAALSAPSALASAPFLAADLLGTLLSGSLSSEPEFLLTEPDWTSLGLILSIVGSFLLANAILFRNPRALVREHYGARRVPLRTIREFIFHRLQMTLGFAFLLSGFALQLVGRVRPAPVAAPGSGSGSGAESGLAASAAGESLSGEFPVLWIGLILLIAILLEVVGWWWSSRAFRRYVRDYLRENPPDFATDVHTAREVGELFGLRSTADETVQSYVARVRLAVGLAPGLQDPAETDEDFGLGGLEPVFEED